jgi:outer membrane immunogenic protein
VRKFAIAFAALALTGPAFAADMAVKMPVKAPPPSAAVNNWTGFYVGGNVGYAWTNDFQSSFSDPFGAVPFATTNLSAGGGSGALGGVQLGWNWQFAPTWVVGIEGDFDWAGLRKSATFSPLSTPGGFVLTNTSFTASEDIRDFASIRGRIGYVWNNNWLAYFTGGGAWIDGNLSADTLCPSPAPCIGSAVSLHGPVNFSQKDWGWVLGGGLEYKAANSPWILGVEYLYYHFNNATTASSPLLGTDGSFQSFGLCALAAPCFFYTFNNTNIQTVRVRLSYRFNWSNYPVATR